MRNSGSSKGIFCSSLAEEFEVAVGSTYSALDTVTKSVNILFKGLYRFIFLVRAICHNSL